MSNVEMPEQIPGAHHEHFRIIINGRPKEVADKVLTYEHVVNFAFDNNPPSGPNVVLTVTYSKGIDGARGSLLPGQSIEIKSGMVFNVKATDRS